MKYKCGHVVNRALIIDNNFLSIAAYLEWLNTVGRNGDRTKCWDCFCEMSKSPASKTSAPQALNSSPANTRTD